jgi:hypothetical protein
MQTALQKLRELPPLGFALMQLAAIAVIVRVAEAREKRDQRSPVAS